MRKNILLAVSFLFTWMVNGTAITLPMAVFTGHYELADAKSDFSFSLDVTQTGKKADVSFSAAMNDGSGAAPDGDGKGEVSAAGLLKFKFSDSFGDEGTATLERLKAGYRLKMEVTKAVEARTLRYYGEVMLKKTADKPSP